MLEDHNNLKTDNLILSLYEAFKQPHGQINLELLLSYIEKDQKLNNYCHIFIDRIKNIVMKKTILQKQQFLSKFNLQITNQNNFTQIFNAIDRQKTGFITLNKLIELNNKARTGLNHSQLQMMISNNQNRISKQQLNNIMCSKQII